MLVAIINDLARSRGARERQEKHQELTEQLEKADNDLAEVTHAHDSEFFGVLHTFLDIASRVGG